MSLNDHQNLSQAILKYLLRHPDAQDSVEGISEWWILEERIMQKYAEVQKALKILVGQGFVLEKRTVNNGVFYCLNKAKKNQIEELLDNANLYSER